jgi:hypothetical protein
MRSRSVYSRRTVPIQRSAIAFARGARTGVSAALVSDRRSQYQSEEPQRGQTAVRLRWALSELDFAMGSPPSGVHPGQARHSPGPLRRQPQSRAAAPAGAGDRQQPAAARSGDDASQPPGCRGGTPLMSRATSTAGDARARGGDVFRRNRPRPRRCPSLLSPGRCERRGPFLAGPRPIGPGRCLSGSAWGVARGSPEVVGEQVCEQEAGPIFGDCREVQSNQTRCDLWSGGYSNTAVLPGPWRGGPGAELGQIHLAPLVFADRPVGRRPGRRSLIGIPLPASGDPGSRRRGEA